MGNLDFDANGVPPSSFEAIPIDDYTVAITESVIKDTKARDGKYIALTFEVLDGEYKGRKVWTNLNIQNPNPKAQQIGLGQLSEICRACGKMNISDTTQLHGIPIRIKVGHEEGRDGELRNTLKRTLWKETTKPSLAAFAAPTNAKIDDDDVPF